LAAEDPDGKEKEEEENEDKESLIKFDSKIDQEEEECT